MKIGIATEANMVAQHFGRCDAYTIVEIENNKVVKTELVQSPGHQPGFLPGWLAGFGVKVVICGGMGPRAQELFIEQGIKPIMGVDCSISEAIQRFCDNSLKSGENICDH